MLAHQRAHSASPSGHEQGGGAQSGEQEVEQRRSKDVGVPGEVGEDLNARICTGKALPHLH